MADISTLTSSSIPDQYKYKVEERGTGKAMDKNAFLNLLVTQLKYQDPLSPTDDKEFVAQMAQFTSLEQMQNLNTSSMMSQGYALIGKEVVGDLYNEQTGETETVTGTAQAVKVKSGKAYIVVNNKELELSKISSVTNPSKDTSSQDMLQELKTINKTITELKAEVMKLKETSTVE